MSVDPRTPCIIGVAQRTVRPEERPAPEPLALWEEVCRRAAADSHARGDLLAASDSIQITYCQSWRYDDPTSRLAERLGANPRQSYYSGLGGTTGQELVSLAAQAILRGEADVVVVCGAETMATLKAATLSGDFPEWSHPHPEGAMYLPHIDHDPGELAIGMPTSPSMAFAIWDTARRAHLGIEPEAYRREISETFAGMTEVAASNPYAWFRQRRDPEFLMTPQADNRMVAYPYTKHTVAFGDVDMAAAVIVASQAAADRFGVPGDRRIFPLGWCSATSPDHAAEPSTMWEVPAMKAAATEAMACAGLGIGDIAHLDLYSCFPSSVNMARDALGVLDRTGDQLTVTGGLPYFGGPASNYMLHSIATMTEVLRDDDASAGMVSGVGMLMGKHAYGIYSARPPSKPPRLPAQDDVQARLDAVPKKVVARNYGGPATVAAYSVTHDRNGPSFGVAICDLSDGARVYARFDSPDVMAEAEKIEFVGQDVMLSAAGDASILTR